MNIDDIKLSVEEKDILTGKYGRLKQVALENIVQYAKVLGAKELCKVTKATVFSGAHNYLNVVESEDVNEVFSKMNLCCTNEIVQFNEIDRNCHAQTCVSVCDKDVYEDFKQSKKIFDKNKRHLDLARDAGVIIAGTCAPYLNGWIPLKGEHFVTTESGVTIIGNSLWGACCNSDGIEAAFWSTICGRTPKWGNHIMENRYATHMVKVECEIGSLLEWDLLGKAVGAKLPFGSRPVLVGNFENVGFNELRQFLTTLAIGSNCELCHIVGITPEANTLEDAFKGRKPQEQIIIKEEDLRKSYASICDEGFADIDFVSVGCPHFDIVQIQQVANMLKGKKIHSNVHFMVWTVYPIRHMAEVNGYLQIIEEAGGKVYTGTCPGTIGPKFLANYKNMLLDSIKQCKSVKNMSNANVFYGSIENCVNAAISGRWEESMRWDR